MFPTSDISYLDFFSLREAEKKNEDIYEEMPLFMIEQEYGGTEAGRTLGSKHQPFH